VHKSDVPLIGADDPDAEWRMNLVDAAIERVKNQVAPKQFQIFHLSVLKDLPVREVTKLLKVKAAQVLSRAIA